MSCRTNNRFSSDQGDFQKRLHLIELANQTQTEVVFVSNSQVHGVNFQPEVSKTCDSMTTFWDSKNDRLENLKSPNWE